MKEAPPKQLRVRTVGTKLTDREYAQCERSAARRGQTLCESEPPGWRLKRPQKKSLAARNEEFALADVRQVWFAWIRPWQLLVSSTPQVELDDPTSSLVHLHKVRVISFRIQGKRTYIGESAGNGPR